MWGPSVGAPGGGRRGPTPPFRVRWACTLGATSPAAAARAHISRLLSKCLTHRAFLQAHDGPRGPEDLQAPPSPPILRRGSRPERSSASQAVGLRWDPGCLLGSDLLKAALQLIPNLGGLSMCFGREVSVETGKKNQCSPCGGRVGGGTGMEIPLLLCCLSPRWPGGWSPAGGVFSRV